MGVQQQPVKLAAAIIKNPKTPNFVNIMFNAPLKLVSSHLTPLDSSARTTGKIDKFCQTFALSIRRADVRTKFSPDFLKFSYAQVTLVHRYPGS
jgi:hypothetical protein